MQMLNNNNTVLICIRVKYAHFEIHMPCVPLSYPEVHSVPVCCNIQQQIGYSPFKHQFAVYEHHHVCGSNDAHSNGVPLVIGNVV